MSQYIGEGASALGSVLPNWMGANYLQQFGQYMNPAQFNPGALNPMGTGMPAVPGSPEAWAGASLAPYDTSGSGGTATATPTATPFTGAPLVGGPYDAYGNPISSPTGGPPAPPVYATPTGTTPVSGPTGAGGQSAAAQQGFPTTLGGWLGLGGGLAEAVNKWMIQRQLQNPSNLAAGANKLYQPMSKALRRDIIGPVRAEAQETGQINAPGLYAQAVASSLAPYDYEMRMNALKAELEALQSAANIWPQGGLFGTPGLVPQGYQGGGAQGGGASNQLASF